MECYSEETPHIAWAFYITKENYQNYDGSQKQRFLQRIFKTLGTLPLAAQYIYTIPVFVVNNTYIDSTSWKILNYMTLKLETTRTYLSHNLIYLSINGVLIMMVSRYIMMVSRYIIILLLKLTYCQVILISLKKLLSTSYIHLYLS